MAVRELPYHHDQAERDRLMALDRRLRDMSGLVITKIDKHGFALSSPRDLLGKWPRWSTNASR